MAIDSKNLFLLVALSLCLIYSVSGDGDEGEKEDECSKKLKKFEALVNKTLSDVKKKIIKEEKVKEEKVGEFEDCAFKQVWEELGVLNEKGHIERDGVEKLIEKHFGEKVLKKFKPDAEKTCYKDDAIIDDEEKKCLSYDHFHMCFLELVNKDVCGEDSKKKKSEDD